MTTRRGEPKKGGIKGVELVNNASIDIPVLVVNRALTQALQQASIIELRSQTKKDL